jgi:hypothetical protein
LYHIFCDQDDTTRLLCTRKLKAGRVGLHNAVGKGFPPTVSGSPVLKLGAERFSLPKTVLTAKRAGVTIYFIFPQIKTI